MQTAAVRKSIQSGFFIGWLLFVALMIAVALQEYIRSGGQELWQPVFWELSSALTGSVLLFLQKPLLLNARLLQTPRRWFLAQFAVLPLLCIVFVILVFGIRHAVYAWLGRVYMHHNWPDVFVYESIKLSLFLGLTYVVIFGVLAYESLLAEKELAEKSQALLRAAQVHRLTQQMQPHFLFNALNTVSSLMYSDLHAADSALSQIAGVLRGALDFGDQNATTLRQELELLQHYANLMYLRFSDRVDIRWEIADEFLSLPVPVMSLQPLLENSFKHTVEKRSDITHIRISAYAEDLYWVLRIEDDAGCLLPVSGHFVTQGISIRNIRERLQVLYGDKASLSLFAKDAGVATELRLPRHTDSQKGARRCIS